MALLFNKPSAMSANERRSLSHESTNQRTALSHVLTNQRTALSHVLTNQRTASVMSHNPSFYAINHRLTSSAEHLKQCEQKVVKLFLRT